MQISIARCVALVASLLLLPTSAYGKEGLKVYISADMEGVAGASTSVQVSPDGSEYQKFRRLLTLEVNAAIEGAFSAGATEVVVSDSHGDAQNIDVELLDPRARLIRAWPRALGMMHGIDESFAAAVLVGFHAREGDVGVLAHTFNGNMVMRLNGVVASEGTFAAAIAGHFGVPVVFLSGDQVIAGEIQRQLGPIEVAVVKEAYGFYSASMLHPEAARKLITAGVERGIAKRATLAPYRVKAPVNLELIWEMPVMAEIVALIPGVKRPDVITTVFAGRDMVEASKFFESIHFIQPPR